MGYILPITHHTYHNYQYRMKEQGSPHQIEGIYKVVFHKINEGYHAQNKQMYKGSRQKGTEKLDHVQMDALQKAKMTGKGGKFNETV